MGGLQCSNYYLAEMRSGFLSGRRRGCMWLLIGEDAAQLGSWNLVGVVGNEVVRVGKAEAPEEETTPVVGSTTSSTTLAVVSKSNLSKIREFRKARLPSTPWKKHIDVQFVHRAPR